VAQKNTKVSTSAGDLDRLEKIFKLMERHEVTDLEWEKGGEKLKLRTRHATGTGAVAAGPAVMAYAAPAPVAASAHPVAPAAPIAHTKAPTAAGLAANQKQVVSPFVGTFYRASGPNKDPYVREGQTVKRGDVLCIIEAMKLMNEIEAELSGKVIQVLVENGQPVEYGEPLFLIEVQQ